MKIFMKTLTNKTFVLENVEISDTISNVKLQLEKQEGIPRESQLLVHAGAALEDQMSVGYYKIEEFPRLVLVLRRIEGDQIQIFVKTLNGKSITLEVGSSNTIYQVKEKIELKDGIPRDQQILTYEGILLQDSRSIASYYVRKHTTIHVFPHIGATCTSYHIRGKLIRRKFI